MTRDILLGVVIGAQGLKGEVKVKVFTESPERLGAYGALCGLAAGYLAAACVNFYYIRLKLVS